MKVRDNQRSRIYGAERLALSVFDQETKRPMNLIECQRLLDQIGAGLPEQINIKDGRGCRRARARTTWYGMEPVIVLPKWARTKTVVCHEAAHIMAGLSNKHNQNFAATFLDLIKRYVGPLEAEILKQAYKECRVKFRRSKYTE